MLLAEPAILPFMISATVLAALAETKLAVCVKVTIDVSPAATPTKEPPLTTAAVVPS